MCRDVFRGLPTITQVTIVDPGPFWAVEFSPKFRVASFSTA
jgi:hypothetical protein